MASEPRSRSRRNRGVVVILSTMALLFCAGHALGQGTDADRAVARTRMAEGRARRSARDLRGALESFRAADALLGFPTTGLEVARAQTDLGLLVEARETLKRVVDAPELSSALPQFKKARAQAAALLGELEPSIPTITILVRGVPAGAPVALVVDGVAIAPGAVAEPLRLNPGHHVVVATTVSGNARAEVDLEAHDAKEVTLSLPPQTDAPSAAVARPVSPPGAPNVAHGDPHDPPEAPPAPPTKDHTLAFVGFGVAFVGATVGTIAGISSISHTKSAESGCSDGSCPPPTHDDLRTAHTLATVSNVFFVVGAVGVGAGIFGLLQKPAAARSASKRTLTPWLTLGAVGVNGTF